jgi:hypothetical protein
MIEHTATVTVHAPVHQVYALFTHFNDFPKFMSFVKEVTYSDQQHSHWVVQLWGHHEWDAINEDWIEDRQIGWRSISGLQNTGRVKFLETGPNETQLSVFVSYTPPAGEPGMVAARLGADERFDAELQQDLRNFARMVQNAPADALDPMSSHYLFHPGSAMANNQTTQRQNASMARDPMMQPEALRERESSIEQEISANQQAAQRRKALQAQQAEEQSRVVQAQQAALAHQAEINRQEAIEDRQFAAQQQLREQEARANRDPVRYTLGGRNAAQPPTPLGDRDARSERFPDNQTEPMLPRDLQHQPAGNEPTVQETEHESPWRRSIEGEGLNNEEQQ